MVGGVEGGGALPPRMIVYSIVILPKNSSKNSKKDLFLYETSFNEKSLKKVFREKNDFGKKHQKHRSRLFY